MEIFLDTANLEEIRRGARLGVVRGVTTNPSLAAKEGIGTAGSYKEAVQEIAAIIPGPISIEVVSQDVEGMVTEGRELAGWIDNPWVKIPSTEAGFEAISVLAKERHTYQPDPLLLPESGAAGCPSRLNSDQPLRRQTGRHRP